MIKICLKMIYLIKLRQKQEWAGGVAGAGVAKDRVCLIIQLLIAYIYLPQ